MFSTFGNSSYVVGRGSLKHIISIIKNIKKKRVALIADYKILDKYGTLEIIKELFDSNGIEWRLIADIPEEPKVSHIEQTRSTVENFKPDLFLAVGGGSVLDAAKAMWVFYEYPEMKYSEAYKPFTLLPKSKKATFMAIPTTSGTGSETTCVSVLIDDSSKTKRLIMSREIIPDYAILDFDLVDTMPPKVAAYSGMDALAHALEAAVCKISNPLVVSTAKMAAVEIIKWLPISVNEELGTENFRKAREAVHSAASLSGMAINNSSPGLSHAMDQIGPLFNIPHGLVCGILLPYTIYSLGLNSTYAEIAKLLGNSGDEEELTHSLILKIINLKKQLGIPKSFGELPINKKDYTRKINEMTDLAEESGAFMFAPRNVERLGIKDLFDMAYEGTEPWE